MPSEKKVKDLMIPITEYSTVPVDALVQDAIKMLMGALNQSGAHRSVVVVDEQGDVMGILTLRDLIKALEPRSLDPDAVRGSISWLVENTDPGVYPEGQFTQRSKLEAKKTVREVMGKLYLITIGDEAPLLKAVHIMLQNNVGSLPVLRDGKLVGMIRISEIFQEIGNVICAPEGG